MCLFQGIFAELLMASMGLTVESLVYTSYQEIVHGRHLTLRDHVRNQVIILGWSLFLALLGNLGPGTPRLNTAGLFCYSATEFLAEGLLFFVGYVIPMFIGFIYMCMRISSSYRVMQRKATQSEKFSSLVPRAEGIRNYYGMWYYVVIMFCCYVSIVGVALYSWVTGEHAPPILWIVFGIAGHTSTVSDPLLYYKFSEPAWKAVREYWMTRSAADGRMTTKEIIDVTKYHMPYFKYCLTSSYGKAKIMNQAQEVYSTEYVAFYFDGYPGWLAVWDRNPVEIINWDSKQAALISRNSDQNLLDNEHISNQDSPQFSYRSLDGVDKKECDQLELTEIPTQVPQEVFDETERLFYEFIDSRAPFSLSLPPDIIAQVRADYSAKNFDKKLFDAVNLQLEREMYSNLFQPLLKKPDFCTDFEKWVQERAGGPRVEVKVES